MIIHPVLSSSPLSSYPKHILILHFSSSSSSHRAFLETWESNGFLISEDERLDQRDATFYMVEAHPMTQPAPHLSLFFLSLLCFAFRALIACLPTYLLETVLYSSSNPYTSSRAIPHRAFPFGLNSLEVRVPMTSKLLLLMEPSSPTMRRFSRIETGRGGVFITIPRNQGVMGKISYPTPLSAASRCLSSSFAPRCFAGEICS